MAKKHDDGISHELLEEPVAAGRARGAEGHWISSP